MCAALGLCEAQANNVSTDIVPAAAAAEAEEGGHGTDAREYSCARAQARWQQVRLDSACETYSKVSPAKAKGELREHPTPLRGFHCDLQSASLNRGEAGSVTT